MIKAHALHCYLARVLHRALSRQFEDANGPHSPPWVREIVKRVQPHLVILVNEERVTEVGELDPIQRGIFETLGLEPPTWERLEAAISCRR